MIIKRKKINLKIAFTTNIKIQDSLKQVFRADDHPHFQVDHQAFHHRQGFLILLTDTLLLHIPIYQYIMELMEDTC